MSKWTPPPGWGRQPGQDQPEQAGNDASGAPRARRGVPTFVPAVTGVCGLLIGLVSGVSIGQSEDSDDDAVSSSTKPAATQLSQPQPPPPPPPAAAQTTPSASDFTLEVKVLSKQCFGEAGCNVTYRIDPSYSGPTLSEDDAWRITYTVTGGEDGPAINSFTLRGRDAEYPSEESISTRSSGAKLTAKVTQILKD